MIMMLGGCMMPRGRRSSTWRRCLRRPRQRPVPRGGCLSYSVIACLLAPGSHLHRSALPPSGTSRSLLRTSYPRDAVVSRGRDAWQGPAIAIYINAINNIYQKRLDVFLARLSRTPPLLGRYRRRDGAH